MTGTTIGYGDLNVGLDPDDTGAFGKKSQLLMYTAGAWMPAAVTLFGRFASAMKGEAPGTAVDAWLCGSEEEINDAGPPCPPPVIGQACTFLYKDCGKNVKKQTVDARLFLTTIRVNKAEGKNTAYLVVGLKEDDRQVWKQGQCNPDECNDQLQVECEVEVYVPYKGSILPWEYEFRTEEVWE